MAKIRNTSGQALELPWLDFRLVHDGQVVDVPDADVYAYTQQASVLPNEDGELVRRANWEPIGEETEQLHEAAAIVAEAAQFAINGVVLTEPAGNASRVEWGAFVVAGGLAEPEELAQLTRDEIRDEYATPEPGAVVPAKSASKTDWVDFAVTSAGADRDEAKAMTKAQLQATYDPSASQQSGDVGTDAAEADKSDTAAADADQGDHDDPATSGEGDTEHKES